MEVNLLQLVMTLLDRVESSPVKRGYRLLETRFNSDAAHRSAVLVDFSMKDLLLN